MFYNIDYSRVHVGCTLDRDPYGVNFSFLMPCGELEEIYMPQINPNIGAPAKPLGMAFGARFIHQRLGLSDQEIVFLILA